MFELKIFPVGFLKINLNKNNLVCLVLVEMSSCIGHTCLSAIKSNAVAPIQRSATPPNDNQSNLAEIAKQMSKSNHGHSREVEGTAIGKETQGKFLHHLMLNHVTSFIVCSIFFQCN